MNIVFATSDLYSRLAAVTLQSLLENNHDIDTINIYYIHHNLSSENQAMLEKLVDHHQRNITFIPMPEQLNSIPGIGLKDPIVYSYCYLQDILPDTLNKVLLIESDTIVLSSLKELYDTDITGYYVAATDDMQSGIFKKRLRMNPKSVYFNSGIMLLNLEKCRQDHISEKIAKLLGDGKSELFYEVQDELNILFEGKALILPPRFNVTASLFLFDYENMIRYRRPSTCCTKEEFNRAIDNPVIVHFTSNHIIQPRPWIEGCTHPYTESYMTYKKDSPSADMTLWPAKSKLSGKVVGHLYRKAPKRLVASIMGFIHAVLHPLFLYKIL